MLEKIHMADDIELAKMDKNISDKIQDINDTEDRQSILTDRASIIT